MRSSVQIVFDKSSLASFEAACQAKTDRVARGTKRVTTEACQEILDESLQQVPKQTNTLASSGYYEVNRRGGLAATTWAYEGTIGYGGNGDPINPDSGIRASQYMVKVHEDLSVYHPTGKAKFLEDPVREYAAKRFLARVREQWTGDVVK